MIVTCASVCLTRAIMGRAMLIPFSRHLTHVSVIKYDEKLQTRNSNLYNSLAFNYCINPYL